MDAAARVVVKPGREKSLRHRHPWVFSGAIARVEGDPGPGETVAVARVAWKERFGRLGTAGIVLACVAIVLVNLGSR